MVEWSFDTSDARAAQDARREFVRHVTAVYGGGADAAAAELVLGELIGNVVRYAPGPACVRAHFDADGVTIAVQDSGTGFSVPELDRDISLLSESGRGLAIVSALVETLEIDCPDDGCCVRARLDVNAS
jgi:anti-sigma regulatory factor (Ser/Thr protein kinase)